jgi:hypothetical protein
MRIILLLLFALYVATPSQVELFRDDFSKFPPGWLSKPVGLLNGAIQEYHYLPHRGVATFPWYNPITHNDSWVAGDEDGKTYLEQHLLHDQPERWQPLFVTGDERDEIIVWDADSVWIYTQDRPGAGRRIYKPIRNPLYNDSNYRATVSLPGWKQ